MYLAKTIDKISYRPGSWEGARIGVFRDEEQIGEYERNYEMLYNTFVPFSLHGNDFALYSPNYTATRIMELPSCKDIGGEEPSPSGFCPVDYFVPAYIEQEWTGTSSYGPEKTKVQRVNKPVEKDLTERTEDFRRINPSNGEEIFISDRYRPLTPLMFYPFGFIAGCYWGDDSSWKVQYLDLSEAEKGILKRDERFGYIELPRGVELKDAIDLYVYGRDENDYSNYIRINIVQRYDLRTGEIPDPWD